MNKIAILIYRNNELKLFLPIIEAMLSGEKKLTPVVITSQTVNKGNKSGQNYDAGLNPFHNQMEVVYFHDLFDVSELMQQTACRVLLTADVLSDGLLETLKEQGCRVAYLQHSIDMAAVWPQVCSLRFFELMDAFFLFSPYWLKQLTGGLGLWRQYDDRATNDLGKKTFFVGMPELDQVRSFDRQKILAKYGVTPGRKNVFFDPIGQVNHVPNYFYKYFFSAFQQGQAKWNHWLKNMLYDIRTTPGLFLKIWDYSWKIARTEKVLRYDKLFARVKQRCQERGDKLICKSRPKNNDPEFIRQGCDLFLYDRAYWPFTLLEMLFISDIYFGFNSSAILEAVYCGLPAMSVQVLPTRFQYGPYGGSVYQYIEQCAETEGEWLNFPGAVTNCRWDEPVEGWIEKFSTLALSQEARKEYVEKFLGFDDGKSSARVLEKLQDLFI